MRQRRRKETRQIRSFETKDIRVAFVAAMAMYDAWVAPEGPAVVKDVELVEDATYVVVYKLISEWGKEAW